MVTVKLELDSKESLTWLEGLLARSYADKNSNAMQSAGIHIEDWVKAFETVEVIKDKKEETNKGSTGRVRDRHSNPASKRRKSKPKTTKPDTSGFVCNDHPTYQGMRVPRKDCDACWEIYKKLHVNEYPAKRRAFEVKMRK